MSKNFVKFTKAKHCSLCGKINPEVSHVTGYTLCCDAPICMGNIATHNHCCCKAFADKTALAKKQHRIAKHFALRDSMRWNIVLESR